MVDPGFGVARVALQALVPEPGEDGLDVFGGVTAGLQLLPKFRCAVLAPGQEPERPFPDLRVAAQVQASAASSASSLLLLLRLDSGSAFSRTWASISFATSGFSLRYWRVLSLPWPMRSRL